MVWGSKLPRHSTIFCQDMIKCKGRMGGRSAGQTERSKASLNASKFMPFFGDPGGTYHLWSKSLVDPKPCSCICKCREEMLGEGNWMLAQRVEGPTD